MAGRRLIGGKFVVFLFLFFVRFFQEALQLACADGVLKLADGFRFNLANTFTCDLEYPPYLFERIGVTVADAVTPRTKVVYAETVGNPTLKICDLKTISQITRKHNIIFVVDNTFTPMMVSPTILGADIVVYSMTKYINGAGDI